MTDELHDRRVEARIRELTSQFAEAYYAGHRDKARELDQERMNLIRSRSPEQIEHMEREQGLFRA